MKPATLLHHLRDILILPVTVTCIVPYFLYDPDQKMIPDDTTTKIFGSLFLLAGLSLFCYTVYLFSSVGKGTVAPWSPKQKLVVTGPYRYCRNPMITGVLLILIGESQVLHSSNILWWAVAFFFINTLYFVGVEEPMLTDKFGEEYRHYKHHVPRWIPRPTPYHQSI